VFGETDRRELREWVETWGGAACGKRPPRPPRCSKNPWEFLLSVVSSKKRQQKENGTHTIL